MMRDDSHVDEQTVTEDNVDYCKSSAVILKYYTPISDYTGC